MAMEASDPRKEEARIASLNRPKVRYRCLAYQRAAQMGFGVGETTLPFIRTTLPCNSSSPLLLMVIFPLDIVITLPCASSITSAPLLPASGVESIKLIL